MSDDLLRYSSTGPGVEGPHVVGVDPSLTATGLASTTGWCRVVGYQDRKQPITKLPTALRIRAMRRVLGAVVETVGRPELVVLESPALSRAGGGAHERGWLWWRIYEHLLGLGVPIGLLTPGQRIKYATGKGTGPKTAVVDAVARRWPDWSTAGDDNAADAVALMASGRDWLGHPIAPMPQTHRAVLDAADWLQWGAGS